MKRVTKKKKVMWMFQVQDYYIVHEDYGRARAMKILKEGVRLMPVHITPTPKKRS